jgi:hypothetical protein
MMKTTKKKMNEMWDANSLAGAQVKPVVLTLLAGSSLALLKLRYQHREKPSPHAKLNAVA